MEGKSGISNSVSKFIHLPPLKKEGWMDDVMEVRDMRHMKIFSESPSLLYKMRIFADYDVISSSA